MRRPPAGPWGSAAPELPEPLPPRVGQAIRTNRVRFSSIAFFILMVLVVGARAYNDLSRPEPWPNWKDLYFSPGMAPSRIANTDPDGSGRLRPGLVISGTIGAATASWFRDRLDEAHLVAGDTVLMSSPGGNLNQAIIMGEGIRSRGLGTAVGIIDSSGHIRPPYFANARGLVYAGGKIRVGIEGSMLGVHRFAALTPGPDPVAETQQIPGMSLTYMKRMGVSPSVVEA